MATNSINAPAVANNIRVKAVWYSGSDAVAKGTPLCYDDKTGNVVAKPADATYGSRFAGTASNSYSASTGSNGRLIEIAEPGSHGAPVLLGGTLSAGDDVQFDADGVKFIAATATTNGRGCAVINEAGADGDVVTAYLTEGAETGGVA